MAMGQRQRQRQKELWIAATEVPTGPGHPFYAKLNGLLAERGFDEFVEGLCAKFYHDSLGRPGIPPGVYFRMLLIGYFEGIDSERGKRNWKGKAAQREAVYSNRRRIRGRRGKALLRKRGELVERSFAHCYETGGMRRTHLRGHPKILKRLLIHVAGFNLGLLMRKMFGIGTPRSVQDRLAGLPATLLRLLAAIAGQVMTPRRPETTSGPLWSQIGPLAVASVAA